MSVTTLDTNVVTITPSAVSELKSAMEKQGKADHSLRVSVMAGGCSGYSYGLSFEAEASESDSTLESNGLKVFVAQDDIPMLKGIEIDYIDSLMGGGFRINNPNAVSTCGCGSSFN